MHLKAIQQMSRIPRSVGIPPLSDTSFVQAFTTQAALATASSSTNTGTGVVPFTSGSPFGYGLGEEEGRVNPLAGMGLSDEQYNAILQNIVNGEGIMGGMGVGVGGMGMGVSGEGGGREKRPLEDDAGDGRDGKRTRFEVVE
jgi:osomolarity two-component system response regulator SKN7